jgi:hypothetical protein
VIAAIPARVPDARVGAWLEALLARHSTSLTRPELLKAIRALSVRYVERRSDLGRRSPTDSAGKRAAFASFYAPLHFLTADLVLRALGAHLTPRRAIVDLGCGTGVAGAAWALALPAPAPVTGIDLDAWALAEARWNWSMLGVEGRVRRASFAATSVSASASGDGAARRTRRGRHSVTAFPVPASGSGIVLGWTVNELPFADRESVLVHLEHAADAGATVVVIEPIARRAAPWWPSWARRVEQAGGRADEWTFEAALPPILARLDADAGFHRRVIKARSLALGLSRSPTGG